MDGVLSDMVPAGYLSNDNGSRIMALMEKQLFQTVDKVQTAIDRLKEFEPPEGYYLAFSGGKDSVVIKALADMAGVKYDAHYSVTTIDPPELVYFIRDTHPDVIRDRPEQPFFRYMADVKKFPPLRRARWCCEIYKETGGKGRFVVTGVRWAESKKRSKRRMVETCYRGGKKQYLNVIVDWMDGDVWEFIRSNDIPYCSLYDEGFSRLGCIGCPTMRMEHRLKEFARWPGYERAWRRAFDRMYVARIRAGLEATWGSGREFFEWWLNDYARPKEDPDQGVLFE